MIDELRSCVQLRQWELTESSRRSPRLMIDLLDITGRWVSAFVEGLPPHGPAALAVSWAGEEQSENGMDTGEPSLILPMLGARAVMV